MTEQNEYMLVSVKEYDLLKHWSFLASDELAVAQHILRDPWSYEDVFWTLRISLREVDKVSPESLLQEIRDSYPNNRVRAALHLVNITEPTDCSLANCPVPVRGPSLAGQPGKTL